MSSKNKFIKIAAIAALIIIPVSFVLMLARAKWVQKKLDYYSQDYTGPDKAKANHQVGNIVLYDQNGHRVSLSDFDSCIIVANIFFTNCAEVCPRMNGQVEALAREFRKFSKIKFLSVSIDPMNDSIPVLRKYAAQFHADKYNWQFCTGNKKEIYDWVLNDLMLASEQRGQNFIHDDKVVIIDKQKNIRSILYTGGTTYAQKWDAFKHIKDDIDNLLYEYRQEELDK